MVAADKAPVLSSSQVVDGFNGKARINPPTEKVEGGRGTQVMYHFGPVPEGRPLDQRRISFRPLESAQPIRAISGVPPKELPRPNPTRQSRRAGVHLAPSGGPVLRRVIRTSLPAHVRSEGPIGSPGRSRAARSSSAQRL